MGRPKKLKNPGDARGRVQFLEKEIGKLRALREALIEAIAHKEGEKKNNDYLHQHVIAYSREIRETRNLLDIARADVKPPEDQVKSSLRSASPEERLTYDAQDAASCDLSDLEIYVEEWCRRQHLRLDIVDGAPILSREESSLS